MTRWVTPAVLAGALLCGLSGPAGAERRTGGEAAQRQAARQANSDRDDDPRKYFWFHREGITPEVARTDIEYCIAQTSTIHAETKQSSGMYGLIGALVEGLIHSIVEGIETRRMRYAGMRMCMGVYGYARYLVPEQEWELMMRSDDAVERLTAFASGPVPTTERLPR